MTEIPKESLWPAYNEEFVCFLLLLDVIALHVCMSR